MDEEKQVSGEQESRGLSFKDILYILRKSWIAIVVFILAGAVGGFVWSKVEQKVAPVYRSSGIIMVSPEGTTNQTASADYSLSNNLTNTVVAFIKTNTVLDNVRNDQELKSKGYIFNGSKLSVSNANGNLMISVKYSSKTPEESKTMVNAVMSWAKKVADEIEEVTEIVDGVETTKQVATYRMLYRNLNIVDTAKVGTKISNTKRDLLLGLGAGVVVAFLFVVIRELSDNTYKSTEEIERSLNIPVLAGIPDYHFDDEKKEGGK